ncbi:MAG: hypothetical protein ACRDV3_09340 [Acidothermaceae bacterium]
MGRRTKRTANAVFWVLVLATSVTACSQSSKSPTPDSSSHASAIGGNGGGSSSSSDSAAAAGGSDILGDNPGCHLLSASDIKNVVGNDLPSLLGNVSGGLEGNTGHQSCTYTGDDTGKGADVNVVIDTFPGTAKDQLSKLRPSQQDQVDSENQIAAGTATLKDVSVGDGGYEVDVHATSGYDESVWFTKGDKVVNVEVGRGNAGGALQLAQEIAGKV